MTLGVQKVLGALRALAILVGIWLLLLGIGWVAGAIPPAGAGERDDGDVADAGPASADAGPGAAPDAGVDGGDPEPETAGPFTRFVACPAEVTAPTLSVVQALGDDRPELAVGCGGTFVLLATEVRDGAIVPIRVAELVAAAPEDGHLAHAAGAGSGDVDGDSLPDLVLGVRHATSEDAPAGGLLWLVTRTSAGALDAGRVLGRPAAVGVALGDLDARPGLDPVAMDRANVFHRRPSQLVVVAGDDGRVTTRPVGVGGAAVAIVDIDLDEHDDVVGVSTDEARLDILFGDGQGRFARDRQLPVAAGTSLVVADLNGDGGEDLAIGGDGVSVVLARPAAELELLAVEGAPAVTLTGASDMDADGRRDLLAMEGSRPVVLRQGEDLAFEPRPLFEVEGEGPTVLTFRVTDLDGDGRADAALLARKSAADAPWEIVLVGSVAEVARATLSDTAVEPASSPVVLRVEQP